MLPRTHWISAGLAGLLAAAAGVRAVELHEHSQSLLDESMSFLDQIYDAKAGYLNYFYYPQAAARHETRSSVWYATGLLQRNRGGDAAEAAKIIRNVIAGQAQDPADQWFGDYTVYPEQPTVGRGDYTPRIYNSWDPNWRGFIGTNLIVIYEEFGALLPGDVRELIVASLYNATVGDSYRVGGVDSDNLYPSYSNPWIMRAAAAGWTGRRVGDANMTAAGEADAAALLALFDRNGTLSEFNSPTYAGVSLYGLTLWAKYLPADSLMGAHGARLVRAVWDTSAQLYNANLRNLAGPWDRAYGYDMNLYVGLFNLYIWTLVGKDRAPVQTKPWAMAHADDFEYAPLIAVLAPFHDALVPAAARAHFEGFVGGERLFETAAFSPPHDRVPRNITAWVAPHLTIGAESFDEEVVGGPAKNPSQWTPAVVQWARADGSVGFLAFAPTESAVAADVAPGALALTYPRGNATSAFTFLVGANPLADGGLRDVADLTDLEGAAIRLDPAASSVHPVPQISFCGLVGGSCDPNHGFEFWNFTYVMPANSSATPSIRFTIELDS